MHVSLTGDVFLMTIFHIVYQLVWLDKFNTINVIFLFLEDLHWKIMGEGWCSIIIDVEWPLFLTFHIGECSLSLWWKQSNLLSDDLIRSHLATFVSLQGRTLKHRQKTNVVELAKPSQKQDECYNNNNFVGGQMMHLGLEVVKDVTRKL